MAPLYHLRLWLAPFYPTEPCRPRTAGNDREAAEPCRPGPVYCSCSEIATHPTSPRTPLPLSRLGAVGPPQPARCSVAARPWASWGGSPIPGRSTTGCSDRFCRCRRGTRNRSSRCLRRWCTVRFGRCLLRTRSRSSRCLRRWCTGRFGRCLLRTRSRSSRCLRRWCTGRFGRPRRGIRSRSSRCLRRWCIARFGRFRPRTRSRSSRSPCSVPTPAIPGGALPPRHTRRGSSCSDASRSRCSGRRGSP